MKTVAAIHIPVDHPAFAGHFPGTPIVPGVVLLDEALHVIATALDVALDHCTLTAVKFTSIVRPGQPLALRFESLPSGRVHFELESAGQVAATGSLSLAAASEKSHER
jgi:3-hydroxymyristoyl/3-hydroxydecanoyl-(acyl carrier protein) dehydratase